MTLGPTIITDLLWSGLPFAPGFRAPVTSPFGPRAPISFPDGSTSRSLHTGIDLYAPDGTPLYAPDDIEIVFVGNNLMFYGNCLTARCPDGRGLVFMHLKYPPPFQPGVQVQRGGFLGLVDATGQATGPHLHLGVLAPGVVQPERGVVYRDADYLDPAVEFDPSIPIPMLATEPLFLGQAPAPGQFAYLVTARETWPESLAMDLACYGGAELETISLLDGQTWRVWIANAPPQANAAFPATLPAWTPFFVRMRI